MYPVVYDATTWNDISFLPRRHMASNNDTANHYCVQTLIVCIPKCAIHVVFFPPKSGVENLKLLGPRCKTAFRYGKKKFDERLYRIMIKCVQIM